MCNHIRKKFLFPTFKWESETVDKIIVYPLVFCTNACKYTRMYERRSAREGAREQERERETPGKLNKFSNKSRRKLVYIKFTFILFCLFVGQRQANPYAKTTATPQNTFPHPSIFYLFAIHKKASISWIKKSIDWIRSFMMWVIIMNNLYFSIGCAHFYMDINDKNSEMTKLLSSAFIVFIWYFS